MNRRSFLRGALALLPLPAFIPAASLWLPKEKAFVPPPDAWTATFSSYSEFLIYDSRAIVEGVEVSDPLSDLFVASHSRCGKTFLTLDVLRQELEAARARAEAPAWNLA